MSSLEESINYKKSSCPCYECTEKDLTFSVDDVNKQSNLSLTGCIKPKFFECYDKSIFRTDIEPRNDSGYIELNPELVENAYDKTFHKYDCPNKGIIYASNDPRLISNQHNGQLLTLDVPPQTASVSLNDIYNEKLTNYGKHYTSYKDINGGSVSYYIDNSLRDPFNQPVFSKSARVFGTMYKDPMGAIKPQYDRQPLTGFNPMDTKNKRYYGDLSFIQDTCESREDLISRQMRKQNQQKFSSRWYYM